MATTKIERTFTAGNPDRWTFSTWLKRGNLGQKGIFSGYNDAANRSDFLFDSSDKLEFQHLVSNSITVRLITNRKFRDLSAWYHIVLVWDTGNATAGNRTRFYVNGVEETSFSTDTQAAQNLDSHQNVNGNTCIVGRMDTGVYFDGEMSHVQFVDGLALAPTEFGEFDSTSGIWKIKTGSYATPGTNGFHLKMEDSSNMDLDSSSNAHTFTTSGTLTATKDNPSNNFATYNPLDDYWNGWTYTNGNNTVTTTTAGNWGWNVATICPEAGRWYCEVKMGSPTNTSHVGVGEGVMPDTSGGVNSAGEQVQGVVYRSSDGKAQVTIGGSYTSYGDSYTVGDIIGIYLDITSSKVYFAKNGTIQNSGTGLTLPSTPINGWWSFICQKSDGGNVWDINFGNGYFGTTAVTSAVADEGGIGAFEYDPSAGTFNSASKDFRAICTKNIKVYG